MLLLGQCRDVKTGKTLNEAVPERQEVLVPSLDLIRLHRSWVDTINDEDKMVSVLLIAYDIEVTSQFITVQIASNRNELSL